MDFHEYLDWGPINVPLDERIQWIEDNSPSDIGWDWLLEAVERFGADAANLDDDRLIWVAPQNATEQAGLYWYFHHFGGGGQMIIADFALGGAWHEEPPRSLGSLSQEYFGRLLETCEPQPWDSSRFPAGRWAELTGDGALLRVVRDGQLQSAPADFFDEMILQHTTTQWTRWSRIVGETMGHSWDAGHSPDDSLLKWRLLELARNGRLELDGDLSLHGVGQAAKLRR